MTGRAVRWAGLAGAVVSALAVMVGMALTWATGPDGYRIVGADAAYLEDYLPGLVHPVAQFYVNNTTQFAVAALLLAVTAGVRGPRARFAACGAAALAAAVLVLAAVGSLLEPESYWEPYEVQRFRLYAVVSAVLAVVVLAGAVALLMRAYAVHHGITVVFPLALCALHVSALLVLSTTLGPGATLHAGAWFAAPAYLLTGAFAVVAAYGSGLRTGPDAGARGAAPAASM
ncbi:hypothetical protein ACLIYP_03070 [Streptomyces nanhaiensis]|uniref:hypothetical protein n=1 Tax=Streptomyces nanhaiensis TaxID=679319 RepID=UPI00399CE724